VFSARDLTQIESELRRMDADRNRHSPTHV
jgi:hypothetical protein